MKAKLRFTSAEDLRQYLDAIGVPERTYSKMRTQSTFGEFTEAQLELAQREFGAQLEEKEEGPDGRSAPSGGSR
ncbi:hypothetical protein [Flaviaesturariibacter amylovorans]|uniref:Uncharacterized protein n=1 Tax=Flaviaesturariibacter amylovorans TaxID=1084520 RepID=A0ABP8HB97_9BACT